MDNQIFEWGHKWKYILVPICMGIYPIIKNYQREKSHKAKIEKVCEAYTCNKASKEDVKGVLNECLEDIVVNNKNYKLTDEDRYICDSGWLKVFWISLLEKQEQDIAIKKLDPSIAEDQFGYLIWVVKEESPRMITLLKLYYEKIIDFAEDYKT